MADIRKLYGNRFTDYPERESVKKVADVSDKPYAVFLILQPPDGYSLSQHLRDETRTLFNKASLDVAYKIASKLVFDSDLWKQVLITNEDYGKRFYKLMLTEKGKEYYSKHFINPSLVKLENESMEYWLNHYIDEDIIRGVDNLLPELRHYLKRELGDLQKNFLEGKLVEGREIEIIMPNGEKRKSQFVIMDIDNIKASNNEENFERTEGYPTNVGGYGNDHNYKDEDAQNAVIQYAQNLEPERLITTSRTPSGTPIITKEGFVVSGNSKVMSIKLAVKQHPEKYDAYKKFLLEEIEAFGIDRSSMIAIMMNEDVPLEGSSFYERKSIRIKNPILVRIDFDFPEYPFYKKANKKQEEIIKRVFGEEMLGGIETILGDVLEIYPNEALFRTSDGNIMKMIGASARQQESNMFYAMEVGSGNIHLVHQFSLFPVIEEEVEPADADKEKKLKLAQAKAKAQKQKIEILKLQTEQMKDGGEVKVSIDKMIQMGLEKERASMVKAGEFIRDFDLDKDTIIKAKYEDLKYWVKEAIPLKNIDQIPDWREKFQMNPFLNDIYYANADVIGRLPNYLAKIEKVQAKESISDPEVLAWLQDYAKRLKQFMPLAIKFEAMREKIGKKRVLTEEEKEIKVIEDLNKKIYDMMPSVNKEILTRLVEDIKISFKPVEEAIYEQENKRYRALIDKYVASKESVRAKVAGRDIPFYLYVLKFDEENKYEKKAGERYEVVVTYLSNFTKKDGWEDVLDKYLRGYIESLRSELLYTIMQNFEKITLPIKNYELRALEVGYKGFEGTFRFEFENGSQFTFYTHAIGAGGYNIQVYHFRYLTHFTNVVLADGTKLSNPSLYNVVDSFSIKSDKGKECASLDFVNEVQSVDELMDAVYDHLMLLRDTYGIRDVRRHPKSVSYVTGTADAPQNKLIFFGVRMGDKRMVDLPKAKQYALVSLKELSKN